MYTINYKTYPEYLSATISGEESFEAASQFWQDLAVKVKAENISKILVLDQVSGRLNTVQLLEIGELITQLFRSIWIAFVDPKEETYADNQFGETVIQNRAGRVVLFRTVPDAQEWLKSL